MTTAVTSSRVSSRLITFTSGNDRRVNHELGVETTAASRANEIALIAEALLRGLAGIEGVAEVRVLSKDSRQNQDRHKVYVVLATHDIERDERIVEVMTQFERLSFDLVPLSRATLIPNAARPAKTIGTDPP